MPRKNYSLDLDDDDPEMKEAIRQIRAAGSVPRRPTLHQLKCGDLNFWPVSGAITDDSQPGKFRRKGLPEFIAMLGETQVIRLRLVSDRNR